MLLLNQPCGQHHGGEGHRNVVCLVGQGLFGHDAPGRAAGGAHPFLFRRHLFQKVPGFLDGAQVGAHRHFVDPGKAHFLHGFLNLFRVDPGAELSHKGGSHGGDHLVAPLDGLDQLEDLALVGNGAEGAVDDALAAGDALVVVDGAAAQFVAGDSAHAAGGFAGTFLLDDGVVGTDLHALAALDALIRVDVAAAVVLVDGLFGADFHTGPGQTSLAAVGDPHLGPGAGVAGDGDDVHQRGIVELFRFGRFFNALGQGGVLSDGPHRQSHGQAQPFPDDGPFQKDAFPVGGYLAGDDFVGEFLDLGQVPAFVGQTGDFRKHLAAELGDRCVDSSHIHNFLTSFPSDFLSGCSKLFFEKTAE